MKPGGVRMVFLTPDLSFACPKGRQCVADIEIDQRLVFYLELISVGEQQVEQQAPPCASTAPVLGPRPHGRPSFRPRLC